MANAINDIKQVGSVIAKISAGMLADKVQFVKAIDKETGHQKDVNGFQAGATINVSKPARFTVGTNPDLTSALQDVTEEKVPLTLSNQSVVGVNLTSAEIATTLDLQQWAKRILDPAMSSMAQSIESTALTTAKDAVYNLVGTAGSTTFDTDTILSAREKLLKNLSPSENLKLLLDSTAMRAAVNSRKGYPNPSPELSSQYKSGYVGTADGFDYLESNLLPTHTRGTATGAHTVTTTISTQGQATIAITGTGSQTLKKGDVFTVASVFMVHPITKATTSTLQQFVVTADATASSGAYASVSVSPAMYTTGTLQNISAFPQSSAVITLVGSLSTGYTQSMAFHPSAFRFASAPLVLPNNAMMAGQETVNGMTVRVWQDPIITTDKVIMRIDCLWGIAAVRPEWATRITA